MSSKRIISYLVGLVLGFVLLIIQQLPSDLAKMVVCDVGQGDAILITKGSNQVLIDGGPSSEKLLSCLEQRIPFYDRQIELIVLTNTDFDHMNGLGDVLDRYTVIQFVTADGVHASAALTKMISKLAQSKISVSPVERGDIVRVGGEDGTNALQFEVLWPPDTNEEYVAMLSSEIENDKREQILGASAKRGNLNERSVVLLLLEDDKKILLMGDAGDQTEGQLVKYGNLPDIDILKVGHHGSKYASTLEFLQIVKPELAVISVGSKNTYGHPTKETLDRLKQSEAVVKRTDMEGTILLEL
jgi:competence protein ComEC